MQKELLLQMLEQNRFTSSFSFNKINPENVNFRVTETAASVGFIYRHIGETTNTFGSFFGINTDVENTTLMQIDTGKQYDIETSHRLIEQGYQMLEKLINETADDDWFAKIETPFFGPTAKIRLFSHILFHISNHCGQISLTIARGKKY